MWEFDVVKRGFRAIIDGVERFVPALRAREGKAWQARFGEIVFAAMNLDVAKGDQLMAAVGDAITDAVLAYDAKGALGGRDWVEEHMDTRQVYELFKAILRQEFPYVVDVSDQFGGPLRALVLDAVLRRMGFSGPPAGAGPAESPPAPPDELPGQTDESEA
ncbi:MAG TPA: hypothetical protein VGQ64_07870 [Candidatus Limnocylindrales bacterium]|jgi:hypothetical protein|nr:hypothetical protein [Candidatus Limnocylindrales bacterium]